MKKKVILLVFVLSLLSIVFVVNGADFEPKLPTDYSTTLTTWGWDKAYWDAMAEGFNELYPNIKLDYTPVANGDYLQKVQISIATGAPIPDIIWSIWDARARMFELGVTEPLNKAPYNFDINDTLEQYHPLMVDSKGNVMGIEQGINPSALAYNKDLAREFFGTDDRKELEAMIDNWDSFIELGKKVTQDSNGKAYMMAGIGDVRDILALQMSEKWVEDGVVKAYLFEPIFEHLVNIRDSGVLDKLEPWTPGWYAAYGQDKYIFAACAIWSPQYTIGPNDPDGVDEWGIMNMPGGNYNNGGTTLSISTRSDEKEAAWEFIRYATLSNEGAEAAKKVGFLLSSEKPYENNEVSSSFTHFNFGDIDLGEFWLEEAVPEMEIRPMTQYDHLIFDAVELVTTSLNNDMEMDLEDAMEYFVNELEDQMSDLEIKTSI